MSLCPRVARFSMLIFFRNFMLNFKNTTGLSFSLEGLGSLFCWLHKMNVDIFLLAPACGGLTGKTGLWP